MHNNFDMHRENTLVKHDILSYIIQLVRDKLFLPTFDMTFIKTFHTNAKN